MRREHRPIYLKRMSAALEQRWARHFLVPHFDAVGRECSFDGARSIVVMGPGIELGDCVQISSSHSEPVRLACWPAVPEGAGIRIGDYAMLNPGVRLSACDRIDIGRNALFAPGVCITDSDGHDFYDRVFAPAPHAPVRIGDNVWVGHGAIICKGVTIGDNSVIGAGSVVVRSIPAHCVAAGNPARVIHQLDPSRTFVSREHVYADRADYLSQLRQVERALVGHNSLRGWLRYLLLPRRTD